MEIKEISKKEEWAKLALPFPQSWQWGEILKKEGQNIKRLSVIQDGAVLAEAQVSFNKMPFGWQYAFCSKGPILAKPNFSAEVYGALTEYFKKEKCIFFRMEPEDAPMGVKWKKTLDINPRATVILSLDKSEEELLKNMHPKTRYNIRLAEKKNLKISFEKNLDFFMKLMKQTAKRDGFKLHSNRHYKEILQSEISRQITIIFEDEPVAVGVFVGEGKIFTYLYGASDYRHRHLMSPYLVQWEGLKMAKNSGYQEYDFFGVAPLAIKANGVYEYEEKHQYAGVTRFKLGFGGEPREDAGTIDIVIDEKKYRLYQWLRRVRRIL